MVVAGIATMIYHSKENRPLSDKEAYRKLLNEHPYSHRPRYEPNERENEEEGEAATPDLAWEQDFLRTMNPALGRPTPEVLIGIMEEMKKRAGSGFQLAPGASQAPWTERGPDNVGGRTRALAWDPNSQSGNKVWAGGVNGGLWYNNDITSATSSWNKINDFWSNIAITCIAFDPVNTNTMYVGTGEGYTAGGTSGARGGGIFKSTDGGSTWSSVGSSSGFYWVLDIVVRDEGGTSGTIYAAVDGRYYAGKYHGMASAGIQRSTNGGGSFTNVSPNVPGQTIKFVPSDLEIASNNRIWCGTKANSYSATDRGGGYVLYSDNGTSWSVSKSVSVSNGHGRVAIGCAPSDSNTVYALVESANQLETVIQTTDYGSNWSTKSEPVDADNGIPNTDFSRGQAWYDLVIAVDPNNANTILAGGVDMFRSTNGGTAWSQISKWSNNNSLGNLNCSYMHADQHVIRFKPGSSSTVVFGNDGGVFYTSSLSSASSSNVIGERNKGYNITQFYSCAIHPGTGSNVYLAGAQDNGTQRYFSSGVNSTNQVYGGDGGFCFIDQDNASYAIASYVYNNFFLSDNSGITFSTNLMQDNNTGKFINPADYHDADDALYTGKGAGSVWIIKNITSSPSTPSAITISGMNDPASHIRCSPYSSTVFVGSDVGDLFKVSNANASYSSTNITGSTMPAGAISCVEIGANDNELLVTFFNYGVTSVWYTSDGGSNWVSKEGNLPDMPVRWALFNPNNRNEVILATDLGVWSCADISVTSPTWVSSNSGLANTRVDMFQLRASDQMVIAATHGRGLFSSNAFAAKAPVADFTSNKASTCAANKITFNDLSIYDPTEWKWTFNPNNVSFQDGTGDTSQNPVVRFTAAGTYEVSLTATNALGSDIKTKTGFITISAASLPAISINISSSSICKGTTIDFSSTVNNEGASPVYQWKVNGVDAGNNSSGFSSGNLKNWDTVTCELSSSDTCAYPAIVVSNQVIMQMNSAPAVTLALTRPNVCINDDPYLLDGGLPAGGIYSGPNVQNNKFDPLLAGLGAHTLTYTFTDTNGCTASASDDVYVGTLPQKPVIQRTNGTNTLQSSVTSAYYEWSVNGVVNPSAIFRSITMTKSGTYTVKVTNGYNCSNTSDAFDAFMLGDEPLMVSKGVSIYPNPNTGNFKLGFNLNQSTRLHLQVFDLEGRVVHEDDLNIQAGQSEKQVVLNLASGTYYLRLSNESIEWKKAMVIQR